MRHVRVAKAHVGGHLALTLTSWRCDGLHTGLVWVIAYLLQYENAVIIGIARDLTYTAIATIVSHCPVWFGRAFKVISVVVPKSAYAGDISSTSALVSAWPHLDREWQAKRGDTMRCDARFVSVCVGSLDPARLCHRYS